VVKVCSIDFIQKTQPAGTLPVLPSKVGSGITPSQGLIPRGATSEKVIAIGGDCKFNRFLISKANFFQLSFMNIHLAIRWPSSNKPSFLPPLYAYNTHEFVVLKDCIAWMTNIGVFAFYLVC
jgi:hypothetical protein